LNKNIEIEIQLISSNGKVPSQKHASDIGYDISASDDVTLISNEVTLVNTGIAINLPQQCAGFVLPRSGLSTKHKITLINSPGLIDPGYTGELLVPLINFGDKDYSIKAGERVAQLVLVNTYGVDFKVVDSMPETDRSSGGFGSTD
jgi:dUTP pyrophosphatase